MRGDNQTSVLKSNHKLNKMKKMKIILPFDMTMHFHNCYEGGNKYLHYFSRALVKQGIDVTIVTSLLEDKKIKEKKVDGVNYVFLPPKISGKKFFNLNSPFKLLFSRNLKKYLEKVDFDLLHSFSMLAYFYLHKKNRKPVITQPWGMEPFYLPEAINQKGFKKMYSEIFIRHPWLYCLKKSDRIASEGDFQLKKVTHLGVKKERVFPLHIGIDLKKVAEFKKKHKNKRKILGIKKNDLVILSVCQIAPDKGIDDILNAFALVKKKVKNAKLIMIGDGVLENMMNTMVKNLGIEKDVFHFKKISEQELYNYYFSSNIFVASSAQDWSMSIQEAMACGLPVISSAQEFLVDNGKNGYVVGIKNPKGIEKGILKIYNNGQIKKMGVKSKSLSKKYDWNYIAKTAIKEYSQLLKV